MENIKTELRDYRTELKNGDILILRNCTVCLYHSGKVIELLEKVDNPNLKPYKSMVRLSEFYLPDLRRQSTTISSYDVIKVIRDNNVIIDFSFDDWDKILEGSPLRIHVDTKTTVGIMCVTFLSYDKETETCKFAKYNNQNKIVEIITIKKDEIKKIVY